ncbi:hypothetical protein GB931_09095 [Modestobacter sp. I12A-02628]|uniref:Transmembrane protein n=1 Tax=Goekera deserti TaxID=2497753 RepID=A0A7K3WEH3_9ACTN|nr:hypothetical protein [Goekera deserti]MPQ98073.1 hypothetical protein [Goekera deserti]NDI48720.1 hypothetical protein [Goekera deserti]NEL54901.1 hypothetical protein [Goekera deserti]
MESNGIGRDVAAAQLAALQADRAALADRAMQPWWYDALLGLMTFGFFASYSLWFPWAPLVAIALYGAGTRWLMSVYRRLTGTWVSGDRPGPTRRAWRVWVVGSLAVLVPALVLELVLDVRGAMAVAGAVLGIGIALVSRWWSRIYIAELRGQL